MADNIYEQIKSGKYKTVRLLNGSIRLIMNDKYYTFKAGDFKSAQTNPISDLYPYDMTPIDECFLNNEKVYYIRGNKAIVYSGQTASPTAIDWNPTDTCIARLIITTNGKTTGFMVSPNSSNTGFGQSMSTTNEIQVKAYGSGSSLSVSNFNNITRITYNGWNIPVQFNAFMANSDNNLTFFNADKYCVADRNSSLILIWKDVKTLFGC